jgi:hypothetical protein
VGGWLTFVGEELVPLECSVPEKREICAGLASPCPERAREAPFESTMNHDFWLERWKLGQLGFHRDSPHPLLQRFWPELGVSGGRVLVPLCGKSTDLDWLAARNHDVVGVEFVPQAVEDYFAERGLTPERELRESFPVAKNGRVCLVVGDFFAVHAGVTGVCDAAYDRGAWVAIGKSTSRAFIPCSAPVGEFYL